MVGSTAGGHGEADLSVTGLAGIDPPMASDGGLGLRSLGSNTSPPSLPRLLLSQQRGRRGGGSAGRDLAAWITVVGVAACCASRRWQADLATSRIRHLSSLTPLASSLPMATGRRVADPAWSDPTASASLGDGKLKWPASMGYVGYS